MVKFYNFLITVLLVFALFIAPGCMYSCSTFTQGVTSTVDDSNFFDISDANGMYMKGRLLGVGLGSYGNETVQDISGMCVRVLDNDVHYFTGVMMEEISIYLTDRFEPGDPLPILVGEFAIALGFTNNQKLALFMGTYEGKIAWRAVRWFTHGVKDGLERISTGKAIPYPTDWTLYGIPVEPVTPEVNPYEPNH